MKAQPKNWALWILLILLFALVAKFVDQKDPLRTTIRYSEFIKAIQSGQVGDVQVKGTNTLYGKYKEGFNNGASFQTTGPTGDSTFKILQENGIIPDYIPEEKQSFFAALLLNWGPILFFLFFISFIFMRQLQAGGGKAMSFGKSRARMLSPSDKKITFNDVAGVEEAKHELWEVVDFLKDPKKYTALGGKIPKGVILVGPPGTGKTLLARAVAGEADVPFFSISGSDFVEMFVGVGASRVRDLFEQGKKNAPCIIFIDEIDAVGRHRGAGLGGGHDEREQTLNQLLVEMDGFESNEGVILVAATNRIDVLDPALLRPGRFDRRVMVGPPDVRGRHEILKVHTKKSPLSTDINLEIIAKGTPGFTGADLANLVNEAALMAARDNKKALSMEHFERAKDKVIMGVERKSMVLSDKEKRITAYHEAGHTLVGMNLPHTDPIHKVSIIPRGMALGVTQTLPNEDMHNLSKERAENFISFLMGGRVAEELVFGSITNGASNDIERATDLARAMVCQWGMSEMGPIKFGRSHSALYGASLGEQNEFSEETGRRIDTEVTKLVTDNFQISKNILEQNRPALERVAEALILWETLDFQQIRDLLDSKDIGVPLVSKPPTSGDGTKSTTEEVEKVDSTTPSTPDGKLAPA